MPEKQKLCYYFIVLSLFCGGGMTAGAVKKSPVIVVKKKRQIAPVTENVPAPAAQERENIPSTASESTVVSMQPQTHPSGLTKKQRKYLRHKQRQRQIRRDNLWNGRQKLPLFRQVFPFPLLWPEDNVFRLMKVGIFRDAEKFVNANPDCGLSVHDCRCVFTWVSQRLSYLRLFAPGALRYDLCGQPVGTVSDADILSAALSVERILRFQQQKAAEAQQNAASGDCSEKND
ncbi:hypothetical protein ATT74_25735 [Salmonella enterica subsp. enterica serovar Panama]|uniref:ProQ/FinO domain-containing protein n=1 Tax=Salmonella enterica subsp. enterica serovar Panama TaxID=29472 RepID=A0A619AIU1_SALET|nr:hypothetical protein [Salmonella enterica subsp. enterica serovar Panama]EGU5384133.1 hypothetical protein [Salmonella enterica]ECX3498369.1 hypothetical protein [Salmonella enterica subsp. enterica serovar Panama]ECX6035845.1 hypothetical protein [Salmonella enterica subsp. enterica serovar Panama]EGX1720507.1 hypothetical protein [Salmonella enterica subsp. enterica serovar Panama]